jgi:DNA-binding GntR family transcriptional regulator
MLIKSVEKFRKTTLRERIYEEVVHLILSGQLPSGGWVNEKQVIEKLRGDRLDIGRYLTLILGGECGAEAP